MVWRYDYNTGRTDAVCRGSLEQISGIGALLDYQKTLASHPMFLAITASILMGQRVEQELQSESIIIGQVEARTRHHAWSYGKEEQLQGSYAELSARMSGSENGVAHLRRSAKLLRETLGWTSLILNR